MQKLRTSAATIILTLIAATAYPQNVTWRKCDGTVIAFNIQQLKNKRLVRGLNKTMADKPLTTLERKAVSRFKNKRHLCGNPIRPTPTPAPTATPNPTPTPTPAPTPACVHTRTFWELHPASWPPPLWEPWPGAHNNWNFIYLEYDGSTVMSYAQALEILRTHSPYDPPQGTVQQQLIAAYLNIANGVPPDCTWVLIAEAQQVGANYYLCGLVAFNNGYLTPWLEHCADACVEQIPHETLPCYP
jgi:hypothetical protein